MTRLPAPVSGEAVPLSSGVPEPGFARRVKQQYQGTTGSVPAGPGTEKRMTNEAWGKLREDLIKRVGRNNYTTWIEPIRLSAVARSPSPAVRSADHLFRRLGVAQLIPTISCNQLN
jgi:hypothetical protein